MAGDPAAKLNNKNMRGQIKAKSDAANVSKAISQPMADLEAKAKIIRALLDKEVQTAKLQEDVSKKASSAAERKLRAEQKAIRESGKQSVMTDRELTSSSSGKKSVSAIEKLYKGATNEGYFKSKEMNVGQKAASALMKSVMSSSSAVSTGLGMLAGSINPATAALTALSWAADQAVQAFIQGYKAMQEMQKQASYKTNLNAAELGAVRDSWETARKGFNSTIDPYSTGGLLKRVTATEMLGTMSKIMTEFKNIKLDGSDTDVVSDPGFIKLALGLEEMGYDMAGGIGEIIKSQYYRNNQTMSKSNDLLNRLVGLSKSSTMSLDELVNIMSATTTEQNLNAWTLMRSGMSAEEANASSLQYGTSKVAIAAAADTLGVSQTGVDAIFGIISEIISSATDPTKLGDLTRKYQVGGMTGGKSITEVYSMLSEGKFTDVFKLMLGSAATVATSNESLGMEYLSSQFGSQITTILGAFGPTTVEQMLTAIDTMSSTMESQQPAIADTISDSIMNAPVTLEDIMNSLFDEVVSFGMKVADWFGQLQQWLNPLSALEKLFGAASKSFVSLTGSTVKESGGITGEKYRTEVQRLMAEQPKADNMSYADYYKQIDTKVMETLATAAPTPPTETDSGGTGASAPSLRDYYISDTAGWFNNDIRGVDPFRISAGYLSPAYKKKFGMEHTGVDYAAKTGTPIPSTVDGTVIGVGYSKEGGKYVQVRDDAGRVHYFGHMSQQLVKKGDRVSMGSTLGLVGATGYATGPHTHYSVKQNGAHTNPNKWAGNAFAGLYKTPGTAMTTSNEDEMSSLFGLGAEPRGLSNTNINTTGKVQSDSKAYYAASEIVNSINNLNAMLSQKLDVVIEKLGPKSGLINQFSYITK